jgi:hypothetical protein
MLEFPLSLFVFINIVASNGIFPAEKASRLIQEGRSVSAVVVSRAAPGSSASPLIVAYYWKLSRTIGA